MKRTRFNAEDFEKALKALDDEMGEDPWLIAFAPITLMSAGGFLAVNFFKNRESTRELDYLLEPQWAHDKDIEPPLHRAMVRVAQRLNFDENWANEEMAFFVPDAAREYLFKEAEKQNIILWKGIHLRVLAVPLEWALERKLRRINTKKEQGRRESDVSDALELLGHLRGANGGPLDRERIRMCSTEMPLDCATMNEIAEAYQKKFYEKIFA